MPDREKVIEMLGKVSYFFKSLLAVGWQCDADTYREYRESVNMAIALLREQKPVEPHVEHDSDDDSWYYGCGACHEAIDYKDKFCRHCGRKVLWDETD